MTVDLPDHLERLGRDLDQAWAARPARPPQRGRPGRRTAAAGLLGLAAVLAAGLARGGSGPGAIERAAAAVGAYPDATIVHWTSVDRGPDGSIVERQEIWGATSAPYGQRFVVQYGPGRVPVEQSTQGDVVTQWDPAGQRLFVRTLPSRSGEGNHPTRIGADPSRIASFLQHDGTREIGLVRTGGREVRRFVLRLGSGQGGDCTYDVDPATSLGVRFACADPARGANEQTWEYLPRTGDTGGLLSTAAQHPGAAVDRAAMQECRVPGQYEIASDPPCYTTGG